MKIFQINFERSDLMFPCKNLTGLFACLLAFPGNVSDSYREKKKKKTKHRKDEIFLLFFTLLFTTVGYSYHFNLNILIF